MSYELDRIGMKEILSDLTPEKLAKHYPEILEKFREYWHQCDLEKACNSTYLSQCNKTPAISKEPEKYLLLAMPKAITRFVASIRLNPWHLKVGEHSFTPAADETCKFCPNVPSIMHILECDFKSPGSRDIISNDVGQVVSCLLPGERQISY